MHTYLSRTTTAAAAEILLLSFFHYYLSVVSQYMGPAAGIAHIYRFVLAGEI